MNRKIRILVLIILLAIWGVFLWLFRISDIDTDETLKTSFLMRNLTWQTDFVKSIPYKKGDVLEYSAIFSTETDRTIGVSIEGLMKILDIERIEFNDRSIARSELNQLTIKESGILKVTGKAKIPSAPDVNASDEVFLVTRDQAIVPPQEQKEELSIENTWALLIPTDIALSSTHFNSNIPNLLSITGKNLGAIKIVNIGGISLRGIFSENKLYVSLDQDVFAAGEHFVFFELTNGQIVTPNVKIFFEYSATKINIANITPQILTNDQDRFVVLQGNGFDKIVSIQLSNNLILKNAEFTPINKQVIGVKIPKWLAPGEYYFNIMDTASIYELKNMKFTIVNP